MMAFLNATPSIIFIV